MTAEHIFHSRMFSFDRCTTAAVNFIYMAVALLLLTGSSLAANLSKSLQTSLQKDTTLNVWVYFRDRNGVRSPVKVSSRALSRRARAGYISNSSSLPVSKRYLDQVIEHGGRLRHEFPWDNAASFSVHASRIGEIASLPFVKYVGPVSSYLKKGDPILSKQSSQTSVDDYHLQMTNVYSAHEYIKAKNHGEPGEGVLLAFFDSGFRFDHTVYADFKRKGRLIAQKDFVDGDNDVSDPDSVANSLSHPYYKSDEHGTHTLSLVAGYDQGNFTGIAYGAQFALARTEDTPRERRVEEDNWAAAMVWAESLGVDIVSSSLGYRDGYTDSLEDYTYDDMDGLTTVVSRAAAEAVKRGVVVVNSMGNEGANTPGTITAPADVDGVISVGAVGRYGIIASFSSTGPTSDGRIKPDLVAPGVYVSIPLIYPAGSNYSYFNGGNGTSFSTPIVAGICALILQATKATPEKVKQKLFASCAMTSYQTKMDNVYGRGIPDALVACIEDEDKSVRLKVYPNVVKRDGNINFEFYPDFATRGTAFSPARIVVRAVDGRVIWTGSLYPEYQFVSRLSWNCKVNGRRIIPGMYFCTLQYGSARMAEKFMVLE